MFDALKAAMTDEGRADALARAEAAEAEAIEAEATALAARARARAIRLRHEADSALADVGDDGNDGNDEADSPDEPDSAEPVPTGGRRRLRRPTRRALVAGAATMVVAALLALSGVMAWQHHGVTRDRERAAEFEAAARQGVVNMTSLDFTKAKDDVGRVLDSSTGEFRDDFQQRAGEFTSVVEQSKVITKGTVHYAAVESGSITDDSAVVLVAATSTVTNAAGAKEEPRSWRLRIAMARDAGQLKMAKVEFVP